MPFDWVFSGTCSTSWSWDRSAGTCSKRSSSREQPGRRAEAVATVLVDRHRGRVCAGVVDQRGDSEWRDAEIDGRSGDDLSFDARGGRRRCRQALPCCGSRASRAAHWRNSSRACPRIGNVLGQLISAVRIYRTRWVTVGVTVLMSVCSHALFALSIYLVAKAHVRSRADVARASDHRAAGNGRRLIAARAGRFRRV